MEQNKKTITQLLDELKNDPSWEPDEAQRITMINAVKRTIKTK